MTQADFVKAIKSQHGEEETDANKYMELAKNAPTPAIRDMLYDIAKDEIMHRAKLECMCITLEGGIPT